MGLIYIATNKTNQKIYIGKTHNSLEKRKSRHWDSANRGKSNYRFHQALRKYTLEGFTWRVLDEASEESLSELEAYYIDLFGSYFPEVGYNMTSEVQGTYIASAETRNKLSEFMKSRPVSDATRKKMSESKKGKPSNTKGKKMSPRPEEVRRKISESLKGRPRPASVREKIIETKKRKREADGRS